jgi:hypothetical protein
MPDEVNATIEMSPSSASPLFAASLLTPFQRHKEKSGRGDPNRSER